MTDGEGEEKGPVWDAARSVRAELPRLVGDGYARLDDDLVAGLRTGAAGRLSELIDSEPAVRDWVAGFIELGTTPDDPAAYVERGGYALPPGGGIATAARYECPVDHLFVWYRTSPHDVTPSCRDHPAVKLVRV